MKKRLLALAMVSMFVFSALSFGGSLLPYESDLQPVNVTLQEERANPAFAFDRYHDYEEIKQELQNLSEAHSDICNMMVLGHTWEGRDIIVMRVSDNPYQEEADETDVLIMGGHHAYELPSVEVPLFILTYILENYNSSSSIREMVDSNDIWFVPLLNPDGREYALDVDPFWRKNRRPIDLDGDGNPEGTGVDVNRNYGHLWSQQGASNDPASHIYCGPSAFSENETQVIQQLAINQGFNLSLSYHTYGQQVFYPWGNSIDTIHPREQVLQAIAGDIAQRNGYTPMEGKDLYPTTGDSDDWLYSEFSTLAFTIELGNQRVVPEADLEGLCQLNLDSALYAIRIAAEPENALLPEWTIMTYMSSDTDAGLANEAFIDINEMEAGGSNQDVNVIVLFDGIVAGDSCIYDIQKDTGGLNSVIISPTVDDQGAVINQVTRELDMSNSTTLRNFVSWTMQNYPAKKYLLEFWGHGDGVLRDFVPDKGNGLEINDLHLALQGYDLDIVGFDTCSMGHFEVAYELRGIADIMIGSEAKEPLSGWDYQASLGKLVLDPVMEPKELATAIVSDYLAGTTQTYITQAAIDMKVFQDTFPGLMNDFANVSMDFAYADYAKIWAARNITDTFVPDEDAVDFFQYLDELLGLEPSGPVAERIQKLLDIKNDLVIFSGSGTAHPEARSMALYFPQLASTISLGYTNLMFSENQWDEYLKYTKYPQSRPILSFSEIPITNSISGPYQIEANVASYNGETINLVYRLNSGPWQNIQTIQSDNKIIGSIPGQANGTLIEYYFLDVDNNITEPYEIKWGSTDYPELRVSVSCDISIADFSIINTGQLFEGNISMFTLNCSNEGTESILANITLTANQTAGGEIIGWRLVDLPPDETVKIQFNWTAKPGVWSITATISQSLVFDTNLSNQASILQLEVSQINGNNIGFLENYGFIIILLTIIWSISMILILHTVRKARRGRKAGIVRSIHAASDFITTAAEFGGDMTMARITLARAEAALARRAFPEAEKLVSKARETAMNTVGEGVEW
ncbi:MAG: M14 family zinc carboxypeptidase [Thermoplasmata archaeon]|nr:M14 family zinc carboxypeptidase [Thermoplasmata archaeon]